MKSSENERKIGIIYERKSSKAQAEKERTLEGTVDTLTKKAVELGIEELLEPILDVISTKEHISKNLEKILQLAIDRKITHLLVTRLDRIGRNPIESLWFIDRLRDYGVKIVTSDGEIDVHDINDLIRTAMNCLFARMELKNLVERTQERKESNFQDRKWNKPSVPFGYAKDGDWIQKLPRYEQIIKEVYTLYQKQEKRNFSKICNYINENYKQILDKPLKPHQVKRILRDPVYVGRPTYRRVVVKDPNLRFIDEETFNETQRILDEVESNRREKPGKKIDIEYLIRKFGQYYTEKYLPIAVICRNCGTSMDKNGLREAKGYWVNNYICPKCGRQQTVPLGHQLDHFISVNPFYCPNCGTPDEFNEEEKGDNFKVTCNMCGYNFFTNRSVNKFFRQHGQGEDGPRRFFDDDQSDLGDFGI